MLGQLMTVSGEQPVELRANPDRFSAGLAAMEKDPSISAFLLDDGFQHRMLARDLDIVLISALQPFGCIHGPKLLREPLTGLLRGDAFILTHADQVNDDDRAQIERTIRRYNPSAPIVHAVHALRGFRSASVKSSDPPDIPLSALAERKWMAFCGIANAAAFVSPLAAFAGAPVDVQSFVDHHDYTEADLAQIRKRATDHGATVLVTTEKDWVKLARFPIAFDEKLPIWRTEMQIEFLDNGEAKLLELVRPCLRGARTRP
jgi:tetraacyldisaccharide 4'-kinase